MRIYLSKLLRFSKLLALVLAVILLTFLGIRAFDSMRGDPLQPWHLVVPKEFSTAELAKADWQDYLAREEELMQEVLEKVVKKLPADQQIEANRYYEQSPVHPQKFATDWNRSYILEPAGQPVGAVVLLHGLTDSPYSLRHIAQHYQERGFIAVAIRLPGHGTVPAGLTSVYWENWSAATNLAVREAMRQAGPDVPLHLVGFSNGGALALKYALDAVEDEDLTMPAQLVLVSPMIGITEMARFAGIAGWPAIFPAFARAAWLGVMPEFNPFKYNSFPVNGARQSSLLTRSLQPRLARYARDGRLADFPPVLTFQSVVDFTTSTRAVIASLYEQLPENGSELVLFDLNRSAAFGPMMGTGADFILRQVVPPAPRKYDFVLITNAHPRTRTVVARVTPAGKTESTDFELSLEFPHGVFSLSHVALPFPLDDSLYGMHPEPVNQYGVSLGSLAPRGERGTLIVSLDSLVRMSSNPFFPYMLKKVDDSIGAEPIQ